MTTCLKCCFGNIGDTCWRKLYSKLVQVDVYKFIECVSYFCVQFFSCTSFLHRIDCSYILCKKLACTWPELHSLTDRLCSWLALSVSYCHLCLLFNLVVCVKTAGAGWLQKLVIELTLQLCSICSVCLCPCSVLCMERTSAPGLYTHTHYPCFLARRVSGWKQHTSRRTTEQGSIVVGVGEGVSGWVVS